MPAFNPSSGADNEPSRLLLPTVLLALLVLPISIAGAAIALPAISADLGHNPGPLQWVVNGFNGAFAVSTLIWGAAAARLGYKRTFMIGAMIMAGGSLMSVFSTSLMALDFGRVLSGIGAGAIATGGTALLSSSYSGAARTRAFALLGTIVGFGLAAGPAISGLVVNLAGWRAVFGVAAIVAGLALAASAGLRVNGAAVPHANARLIDFSPLRNRRFLAIVLVPVAGSIAYVSILTYLPVALSAVLDMEAARAGVLMLPLTLPVLFAPFVASMLVQKVRWISTIVIINISLLLLIAGDVGLLLLGADVPLDYFILPLIALGFGWGLPLGLIDGEALAAVPAEMSGEAAGVLNFLRLGSEAVSVAIYGAATSALLVTSINDPEVAHRVSAGWSGAPAEYAAAFHIVVTGMAVLTAIFALVINALYRSCRRSLQQPSLQPNA